MIDASRPSRRSLLAASAALLIPGASCARPTQALDLAPMRCADFLDGVGVNTHVSYADSQYDDPAAVLKALRYVGFKFVRDVAINSKAPNPDHYRTLAAAGVSFCLFWGARRTMADAIEQIAALESAHPGAVHALEGPNEIQPGFAYRGASGNAAGVMFMADMRAAAAANAQLRDKPLVCFTTYARVAADCDFANAHPYPKAGTQPAKLLGAVRERFVGPDGVMPGKPMMFTEFGYHTLVGPPTKPGAWQGVDLERQAALIVNGLFDAAAAGIARTYIYQLLDAYPETGGVKNQEKHFGLFGIDGSPKPAASALRTLFARLADDGPRARVFAPTRLDAQIEASAPVSALSLQDSAGRHYLALWNESPIWNKDGFGPLDVAPSTATVTLARAEAMRTFHVVDARGDGDLGRTTRAEVAVGGHPVILRIG